MQMQKKKKHNREYRNRLTNILDSILSNFVVLFQILMNVWSLKPFVVMEIAQTLTVVISARVTWDMRMSRILVKVSNR